MKDPELDLFEDELRKLTPARLPADLRQQLVCARGEAAVPQPKPGAEVFESWRRFWWWLVPATAVLLIAAGLALRSGSSPHRQSAATRGAEVNNAQADARGSDQLEIEQDLLASYETVADLPTGEPVRFRVDEWVDKVTLRDPYRGIAVERRTPRVEVVPVRFESY